MRVSACILRRRVRVIALLIAFAVGGLVLTGCSTVTTGEETPATPVGQIIPSRLALVHTGCVMGRFAPDDTSVGLAAVAGHAKALEAEGYDVLLVDSGNSLLGTTLVDLADGENAIALFNAAGYDALALGASELSLGGRTLATRSSQSDFALLSANATKGAGEQLLTDASTSITLSDGRLVGIFGLTAPTPAGQAELPTAGKATQSAEELIACAQEQVALLRKEGCRLVVCLTNLGTDEETLTAAELAHKVSGIDVILDAGGTQARHEAQTDASGDETLVVTTPQGLAGATTVFWEQGTLSAKPLDLTATEISDEQIEALLNQTAQEQETWLSALVATSSRPFYRKVARRKECSLGDLVADAVLWEGRHAGARGTPDVALVDAGSLRASLRAGDITRADIFSLCPRSKTRLYTLQVSGAQLAETLSQALASTDDSADFPQVAGMTIERRRASRKAPWNVEITTIGDRAFSPTDQYLLVVTERIAAGHGPYAHLTADGATITSLDTSTSDALIDYLTRSCHGTVPASYDEPQGRLVSVTGSKQAKNGS